MADSSSLILKLKAENNPWHCDCDMKELFQYISKQASEFSGFTCKWPVKHENVSWTVLGQEDCSVYTTLNIAVVTEKPTTLTPRSSVYSTSAIVDVTAGTSVNSHMPTSSLPVDTLSGFMWVLVILLTILILMNGAWLYLYLCKRKRATEQTREKRGALSSGEDSEQRLQDSAV
jgi:hypothetical protein